MTKKELIKELEKYRDDAQVLLHIDKKRDLQIHAFIYSDAYNEITISFPYRESANYVYKKRKEWKAKVL